MYTTVGPPPRLDGRRQFQGKAQLTQTDRRILKQAAECGVRICHEGNEVVFRIAGAKQRRESILRLRRLGYLIDANDGLFANTTQTLLVNLSAAS
jgi:hypothetical protein